MPFTSRLDAKLPDHFKTDQCSAICASPSECCFFYCCNPCAVYVQRKKLLDITKEPYVMCAGTFPYCGFDKPMSDSCLFVEVCCCNGAALAGNKFMAQSRFGLKNDCCDKMLSIFNPCVSLNFMLMRCCCECSTEREEIAKATCCTCVCAHCQTANELDDYIYGKKKYTLPPASLVEELPVHFKNVGVPPAAAPVQLRPM